MDIPKLEGESGAIIGFALSLCLYCLAKTAGVIVTIVKSVRESDNKKVDKLSESLEKNTRAVHELTTHLKGLEQRMVDTDKEALKLESRHAMLVAVVKELAGDSWQKIQQKIKDDQFIERPE